MVANKISTHATRQKAARYLKCKTPSLLVITNGILGTGGTPPKTKRLSFIRKVLLGASFSLFTAMSCVTPPKYTLPVSLPDDGKITEIMLKVNERFPPAFQLKHRIVVNIRDEIYTFTGVLNFKQPNLFTAHAYADDGPAVFVFGRKEDGRIVVQKKPSQIALRIIEEGIIKDILHIYGLKNPEMGQLSQLDKEKRTYIFLRPDEIIQEYSMTTSGLLLTSATASQGLLKRRVYYKNYQSYPLSQQPLPSLIEIKNYLYDYSVEISTLDFKPEVPGNFDTILKNL